VVLVVSLEETAQQHPTDDLVQPFIIERSGVRGRLLRLGPVVDELIRQAGHPAPVDTLMGEVVALGAVLASTLKYDGVFTLQTSGDGPVRTLMMDATSQGALRAYAGVKEEELEARLAEAPDLSEPEVATWLGKGHMAFTVDQGPSTERYQGIVELFGPRLADCLLHYFRQSEQVNAGIIVAAAERDGVWRAGALLVQRVPGEGGDSREEVGEEDWRRALVLAASCTADELLDPALPANDLLYRLFHEEGVRVFEPRPLSKGCRCSRGKVENIFASLPKSEIDALKEDGEVVMTCQFCNIDFRFDEKELEEVFAE
jgi:molecular chaperone Hsp33